MVSFFFLAYILPVVEVLLSEFIGLYGFSRPRILTALDFKKFDLLILLSIKFMYYQVCIFCFSWITFFSNEWFLILLALVVVLMQYAFLRRKKLNLLYLTVDNPLRNETVKKSYNEWLLGFCKDPICICLFSNVFVIRVQKAFFDERKCVLEKWHLTCITSHIIKVLSYLWVMSPLPQVLWHNC